MTQATVAICCFNGAEKLPGLLASLATQISPTPFEILVIDNKSTDGSAEVANEIARALPVTVRVVAESRQGIPYARNRAIEESAQSDYLAFIDVDELPGPNWLSAAIDALCDEGADCVGGKIQVHCGQKGPPDWLDEELIAFLGALDHGATPMWVKDRSTPIWSGNVAYRRRLFDDGLRFDVRYNRIGNGVGGGSDGIMFRHLLGTDAKLRYRPDMIIEHHVEAWRLRRRYFINLHYIAGRKAGEFEALAPGRMIFGVPGYLFSQCLRQLAQAISAALRKRRGYVRKGMNFAYSAGLIIGQIRRHRNSNNLRKSSHL